MSPEKGASDPGGSGVVLGAKLVRYAGVQGISLGISNLIQLGSLAVVANFLGPADLGQYALLLFLSGVITQVFVVLSKAGTIRRVFGGGDDDDDDDEDESQVSASPQRSLGVGILWSLVLGIGGAALMVAFSEPLADWLLGDDGDSIYVVWAAATVAFWPAAKLTSIAIWFERRPTAFVIADASRPLIALIALVVLLAAGAGIEGAIASTAFGVAGASVVGIFLLRRSFHPAIDPGETWEIIKQAKRRAPVVFPFWVIQNADVFLLSRVISETELGIYTLASRLGLVVSFLPQGFRMAMRPLRKGAIFQAVSDEYGAQTQKGQLLGYFTLLCIFAVLVMILLGEVIVEIAPPEYADAAPLIPFAAGAFVMPAFYRTVNQNSTLPDNRRVFVAGCLGAMVIFCGLTYGLASEIGAYAAPIGMLIGFGIPSAYMFVRTQRGKKPIVFPYREVLKAFFAAALIAAAFLALPDIGLAGSIAVAVVLLGVFVVGLVVMRVIPRNHWVPLLHMARSSFKGSTVSGFNPRAGIRSIPEAQRKPLRRAVNKGIPAKRLRGGKGEELVGILRRLGDGAGVPGIVEPTERDEEISVYLFERAPTAVRNASMRRLLSDGAPSDELRALEDLVGHLKRVPADAWAGEKKNA
ncbi:MAG TPA: oligosaccharide flippase family protein [Solirubrobacterales bacterium]|nr:oligosaccharide flippase family protein [Solirubrobacterales bacterium]